MIMSATPNMIGLHFHIDALSSNGMLKQWIAEAVEETVACFSYFVQVSKFIDLFYKFDSEETRAELDHVLYDLKVKDLKVDPS